jgi:hypothetical protein
MVDNAVAADHPVLQIHHTAASASGPVGIKLNVQPFEVT